MANPCSTAARRLIGPPAAKAHDMKAVAHAHGSPSVLLRVCLRSNLRREPGRWLGVSPRFAGKASSVSPIPARIALQGGERAGADAIYPCPSQEKSNSWDLLGRQTAPGTGISSGNFSLTGLSLPLRCQDTRTEAFLRNLLTITRIRGGVNFFFIFAASFICDRPQKARFTARCIARHPPQSTWFRWSEKRAEESLVQYWQTR